MIIVGPRQLFIDCHDECADNLDMVEKAKFLKWAKSKPSFHSQEVASRFKVGRQTAAFHLKRYVESGQIFRSGSTRGAVYSVTPFQNAESFEIQNEILFVKKVNGLDPGMVLEEVEARLPLKKLLSQNVRAIFSYSLIAVLANVVDHSGAERCWIRVKIEHGVISFSVEDRGVGLFAKLKKEFDLDDDFAAAHRLFKGPSSVKPDARRGQGIFFVSRLADQFQITSHKLQARIDNAQEDFILLETKLRRGTKVDFSIRTRSKKNLQKIFQEYANDKFEIENNQIRLCMFGEQLMSRAQAQKVVAGLENFERIIFDFKKVEGIGEAFADEVFRVFQKRNPQIKLDVVHANLAIQFMIARVI